MTAELPTGTVTFLFTDLEGSTELLTRIGKDDYGVLLAEHHRLIRAAIADARGHEVDTQGEAFFAAFPSATDAVAAAARLQRDLAAAGLKVRIGLHTGQPSVTSTGYVGLDVPRAARICAAAHGGQVLLSQTTRELVEDELPDGLSLRDLGEHRLKDLTSPQRLSQLVIVGLPDEFPSLRTLENRPTNLPVQPTPLIGREREVLAVQQLLQRDDVRLLTLTGPGGSGKTRLALQTAAELVEDFPHGLFLVAFAPIADPALLVPTIAQTVGVKETGAEPILSSVKEFLAERHVLLVLDNVEHVVEAAPVLSELLAAGPGLKLLATSRTPLHLSGEHEFQVPSLSLPDPAHLPDLASMSQYEAVALFVDRAQAVKSDFAVTNANAPAIAEICVRLDGLPLAIELAAARAKLLSPQALLARLEQRFDLLTGGPRDLPERQQTLRATIDWSYGLLGADEQTLFARLAVFVGGCTLEAAEAICGSDGLLTGLSALIDNNLLRQEEQPDGEPRFTMLETIRAYAVERLEASGESEEIGRGHAEYFAASAGRMDEAFMSGTDVDWRSAERDHDNFRTALSWAAHAGEYELLARIANALPPFWVHRGFLAEGSAWLARSLESADRLPLALHASALERSAVMAWQREDYDAAGHLAKEALDLARKAGERVTAAFALRSLGLVATLRGDTDTSNARYDEAMKIFRELNHAVGLAITVHDRALWALGRGDHDAARSLLEESLSRGRELNWDDHVGNALCDLGVLALSENRVAAAAPYFAESIETALRIGWHGNVVYALRGLAAVAAAHGDLVVAARLLGAAETMFEHTGEELQPYARPTYATAEAPVRERLDDPAIAAAWAAGKAMNEADAAAYALANVAERVPL